MLCMQSVNLNLHRKSVGCSIFHIVRLNIDPLAALSGTPCSYSWTLFCPQSTVPLWNGSKPILESLLSGVFFCPYWHDGNIHITQRPSPLQSRSKTILVHFPRDQPGEAKCSNKYWGGRSFLRTAGGRWKATYMRPMHAVTLQSKVVHLATYKPLSTALSNYIAGAGRVESGGRFKEVCLSHP